MTKDEAITAVKEVTGMSLPWDDRHYEALQMAIEALSAQPDVPDTNVGDMISRQTVLRCLIDISYNQCKTQGEADVIDTAKTMVSVMPSAQIEQRYTEEELRVFQHGISLSLLLKKSAQHWRYDEDTATEIKFLERLYEKVGADMRGEQDGKIT